MLDRETFRLTNRVAARFRSGRYGNMTRPILRGLRSGGVRNHWVGIPIYRDLEAEEDRTGENPVLCLEASRAVPYCVRRQIKGGNVPLSPSLSHTVRFGSDWEIDCSDSMPQRVEK